MGQISLNFPERFFKNNSGGNEGTTRGILEKKGALTYLNWVTLGQKMKKSLPQTSNENLLWIVVEKQLGRGGEKSVSHCKRLGEAPQTVGHSGLPQAASLEEEFGPLPFVPQSSSVLSIV